MSWYPQWSHYWIKNNNFYTIVSYSNNITKNIEYRLVCKVPGIAFCVIITDMIFPELKVFIGQLYLLLLFFSLLLKLTQCLFFENYIHKCNISWLYLPFQLLASPLIISPLKLHGLLLLFIHLFLTHWIQLILPICSYTWGHPSGYKKKTLPVVIFLK